MISYSDVRLNLLIMMRTNTKSKKKTLTMMSLFCHLTKRKNKPARVNMRMIKNAN